LFPNAIAVDPQGDFFIAGDTTLDGLFTSPGAFQAHHPASTGHFNPYIAEYDPSGQGVIAATYLGSPEGGYSSGSREYVSAIALSPVDPNLLYVVGSTVSPNFPVQSYLNLSRLQPFQSSLKSGRAARPKFRPGLRRVRGRARYALHEPGQLHPPRRQRHGRRHQRRGRPRRECLRGGRDGSA